MTHTTPTNGAQRTVHDEAGKELATIEEKIDGFHVLIRDCDVACVGSYEAAVDIARDPQHHTVAARLNEEADKRGGRSKTSYLRRGPPRDGEQWAWRTVRMLESPAYRVLSLTAHRILDRLEIEIAHHGGHGNGKLAVTYAAFEEYGLHRHAIAPALRELVALGFLEITEEGRAGNREYRRAAKYRLTHRPTGRARETNEWQRIATTVEGAERIARAARKGVAAGRRRKQKTSGGKRHVSVAETTTEDPAFSVAETTTKGLVSETATTFYISSDEGAAQHSAACVPRSAHGPRGERTAPPAA